MITFLKNLKLSGVEWLVVSAGLAIGALVVALRVQGSRLHAAQIALLAQALETKEQKAEEDSTTALARYDRAKEAFLKAGGEL